MSEDDDEKKKQAELNEELAKIEEENAGVIAMLKEPGPPPPPGAEARIWGRIAVAEARRLAADVARLRALRDAGLAYLNAHASFMAAEVRDDHALFSASVKLHDAEEALRVLLRQEEKLIAEDRRKKETP